MRDTYEQCVSCGITRNSTVSPSCPVCEWNIKMSDSRKKRKEEVKSAKCKHCGIELERGTACRPCIVKNAKKAFREKFRRK